MVNASPLLVWSFSLLSVLVAAVFVGGVAYSTRGTPTASRTTLLAAAATFVWLALTWLLAARGLLSFTTRPPTMVFLVVAIIGLAVAIGTSRLGLQLATRVPLAALVGVQAFRVPVELLLHRAYEEGLMPVQMSFEGLNFDIISGLSAIVVALALVRRPGALRLALAWNVVGVLLLANILIVALLSAPTPIRVFHTEPANVWITHEPWVWLPSVLVLAAMLGHILVFRRLREETAASTVSRVVPRAAAAV